MVAIVSDRMFLVEPQMIGRSSRRNRQRGLAAADTWKSVSSVE